MRSRSGFERGAGALAAAFLLAWSVFYVAPGLAPGRTLAATDLLLRFPPWSARAPSGWEASNYLLFDQATQFFPWRALERAYAGRGLPPLWNPFAGCGSPLAANFQSAAFAPVDLAVAWLPWDKQAAAAAAARLALATLGMLLFLRALGVGWAAASFGALAFGGSGSIALLLYHPNSNVSCWLPLVAWLSLGVARGDAAWKAPALGLALGSQHLGGHPETSLYVTAGSLAVWIMGLATTRAPRRRALGRFAAAHALGLLLASVQLLPFAEYLRESDVVSQRGEMRLANPPAAAVGIVAPKIFGAPTRPNTYFGPGNYHDVAMQYGGLVALVIALAGLLAWASGSRRARMDSDEPPRAVGSWTGFAFGIAAVSLLLVYPTPVWHLAELVPPFRTSANVTGLTLLYCFSAALLAALALERLKRVDRQPVVSGFAVLAGLAGVAAIAAAFAFPSFREPILARGEAMLRARYLAAPPSLPLGYYLGRLPLVFEAVRGELFVRGALALGACLLLLGRRKLGAGGMALGAVLLLALDLAGFGRGYVPAIRTEETLPSAPELTAFQGRTGALLSGVSRVLPLGRAFPANSLTLWGIEDFRLYDAIGSRGFNRFEDEMTRGPALRRRWEDYRRARVDAAGIDWIASEDSISAAGLESWTVATAKDTSSHQRGGVLFYWNRSAWPRAFFVERATRVADDDRARAAIDQLTTRPSTDSLHTVPERALLTRARVGTAVAPDWLWRPIVRRYRSLEPEAGIEWVRFPWPALLGPWSAERGRALSVAEAPLFRRGFSLGGALYHMPTIVIATTAAKRPGWLVLLDQDYPGWSARLDGHPAEVARAYGLFRAVRVPAGQHQVAWSYRPASFAWGLVATLFAMLVAASWLAAAAWADLRHHQASREPGRSR